MVLPDLTCLSGGRWQLRHLLDEQGPARGGQLGAPPRAAARGEQERAG